MKRSKLFWFNNITFLVIILMALILFSIGRKEYINVAILYVLTVIYCELRFKDK